MSKGNYYVYITTNPRKTTLYTGVTNDLKVRLKQHYLNRGNKKTFASKYYCHKLIYFEYFSDINQAIAREKEIISNSFPSFTSFGMPYFLIFSKLSPRREAPCKQIINGYFFVSSC